ncbi:hypothetical protein CHUAL_005471 [Chamberlinius hualienensis]
MNSFHWVLTNLSTMFSVYLLILLVALAVAKPTPNQYVEELVSCYESENDELETCLQEFYNNVKHQLIEGIPEINLAPLDPMKIDSVEMEDEGMLVQTKSTFSEVEVTGAGEYEANTVKIDKKAATLSVDLSIPALYIVGHYQIDGVVVALPVHGTGRFSLNLTDVEGTIVSHLIPHGAGVKADKITVDFKVGDLKVALKGLNKNAEDTEIMEQTLMDLINNNSKEILEDVKPMISQRLSETMMTLAGNSYLQLPPTAFID